MSPSADLLKAALEYASRGWRVLPLHSPDPEVKGGCSCPRAECESQGKHPRVMHWLSKATNNADEIRRWWDMWPNANVGLLTGGGLIVLDVDPRNGGDVSLAELEVEFGEIVRTPTVRTGGGGCHVYFAGDLPARNGFRPGLDLKSRGGFVVAPPSLHISGQRYEWTDAVEDLQQVPEWLLEVVRLKKLEKALETQQHDIWEKIARAEANFLESVSQGDESIH